MLQKPLECLWRLRRPLKSHADPIHVCSESSSATTKALQRLQLIVE